MSEEDIKIPKSRVTYQDSCTSDLKDRTSDVRGDKALRVWGTQVKIKRMWVTYSKESS